MADTSGAVIEKEIPPENPVSKPTSKGKVSVKFEVELGDDSNRTIFVNTLNQPFRGSWSLAKFFSRKDGGRSVGEAMNRMPDIPGQRFVLNSDNVNSEPKKPSLRIYDPLTEEENEETLRKINSVVANSMISPTPYKGVDSVDRELDEHEFKTLVRELVYKISKGMAKCTRGTIPTTKDVDSLPGRYLYDPGNTGNHKPKFEDQLEAFMDKYVYKS